MLSYFICTTYQHISRLNKNQFNWYIIVNECDFGRKQLHTEALNSHSKLFLFGSNKVAWMIIE